MIIILTASFFVSELMLGELIIFNILQESQRAFYAVDTGVECALYWDIQQEVFPASDIDPDPASPLNCNSVDITASSAWGLQKTPTAATTSFSLLFSDNSCAFLNVGRHDGETLITAVGRNMGDASCNPTGPRVVERGIRIEY